VIRRDGGAMHMRCLWMSLRLFAFSPVAGAINSAASLQRFFLDGIRQFS